MSLLRVFDISRPISSRDPIYPGNPKPKLATVRRFAKDGSNLSELSLGLHTATHLDAPLHYLKNGKPVDRLGLEQCIGWCRVVDVKKALEIGEREINRIRLKKNEIVLFKTRNSHTTRRFDPGFVHLTGPGAWALIKAQVKAVGTDGPSIRKFRLRPDTVHPMLLRAGLPIYEGLDLRAVSAGRYYFIGFPLKISGAEASPVRAVLIKT